MYSLLYSPGPPAFYRPCGPPAACLGVSDLALSLSALFREERGNLGLPVPPPAPSPSCKRCHGGAGATHSRAPGQCRGAGAAAGRGKSPWRLHRSPAWAPHRAGSPAWARPGPCLRAVCLSAAPPTLATWCLPDLGPPRARAQHAEAPGLSSQTYHLVEKDAEGNARVVGVVQHVTAGGGPLGRRGGPFFPPLLVGGEPLGPDPMMGPEPLLDPMLGPMGPPGPLARLFMRGPLADLVGQARHVRCGMMRRLGAPGAGDFDLLNQQLGPALVQRLAEPQVGAQGGQTRTWVCLMVGGWGAMTPLGWPVGPARHCLQQNGAGAHSGVLWVLDTPNAVAHGASAAVPLCDTLSPLHPPPPSCRPCRRRRRRPTSGRRAACSFCLAASRRPGPAGASCRPSGCAPCPGRSRRCGSRGACTTLWPACRARACCWASPASTRPARAAAAACP